MALHDYIVVYNLSINGCWILDQMTVSAFDEQEAIDLVRSIIHHRMHRVIINPEAYRKEIYLDE